MQPLEGIRVADFSHIMAGPYATHLLRLLGAEVIKIEAPGRGDALRYYGSDRAYDGMAPAFIAVNAGKKSLALDLKNPAAVEAARKLIAQSDVVVENFRPGVMTRLGLGYNEIRALKPDIVYCSISGYGQSIHPCGWDFRWWTRSPVRPRRSRYWRRSCAASAAARVSTSTSR